MLLRNALLCCLLGATLAHGQNAPVSPSGAPDSRARWQQAGSAGVGGVVESIQGDTWTLRTFDDAPVRVTVDPSARFIRDRQPVERNTFKVGDVVMARGEFAGGSANGTPPPSGAPRTLSAKLVVGLPSEQVQRMREGLGKQWVAGRVTAIDETKLTIQRIDGRTQTIAVDENTSFRRGRESITLADIKVGDRISARGQLQNGVFTPTQLSVADPNHPRGMGMDGMFGAGGAGPDQR